MRVSSVTVCDGRIRCCGVGEASAFASGSNDLSYMDVTVCLFDPMRSLCLVKKTLGSFMLLQNTI